VTLNTDNTLFAQTSISGELQRAVCAFDLTLLQTENLLLNGFKSAFLSEKKKSALIGEVLATYSSLRDKFALDDLVPRLDPDGSLNCDRGRQTRESD
jgi:adenosine deaminase